MRGLQFAVFVMVLAPVGQVLTGCTPKGHPDGFGTSGTTTTGDGGTGGDIFTTTTGEGGGPVCDGDCYLWKSALFEDLSMFWVGPPGEAPPCPATAPAEGVILHADPQPSPMICPMCSCTPGGCALPEEMHVSAAKCAGADGAVSIAWDSPGWEGACTSDGAIPPGLMCSGVPCTQSVTISPPSIEPCEVVSQGSEARPDPSWGLEARECIVGPLTGEGCGGSEACVAPPPDGFSLCLYRWGDDLSPDDCPADYPRYLVMYAGADDERACEPCACSEPQGAECSAQVSVYTGGACGAVLGTIPITSAQDSACLDLPPGIGLGSKAGTVALNKPGSCTATGGPIGGVTPTVPFTLCCQPELDPTP